MIYHRYVMSIPLIEKPHDHNWNTADGNINQTNKQVFVKESVVLLIRRFGFKRQLSQYVVFLSETLYALP